MGRTDKRFMIPQNVTSRYARNLLVKGTNNEFEVIGMKRTYSEVDGLTIGHYYNIAIKGPQWTKEAAGVTPEQAVNRCLTKHGVTFR
jgi:hypothetical protein